MKRLFIILGLASLQGLNAQTTHFTFGDKSYTILERLEIKLRTATALNSNHVRPFMRLANIRVADSVKKALDKGNNDAGLTKIDEHLLNRLIANSAEYSGYNDQPPASWKSRKSVANYFWNTPGNFIEVNQPDFYLSINPALSQQQSIENDYDQRTYVNSKGMNARGLIAKRIGFLLYVTDNQEQGPQVFRSYVENNTVVPQAGFWKRFKTNRGVDYIDARGSVNAAVGKYVNVAFGYDQHFIGNGYRSLFLANFAPPTLYLKLNTRFKKIDYTNLFYEAISFPVSRVDILYNKKYIAMHHLSVHVTNWLKLGLFESTTFGKRNSFTANKLQPIIGVNSLLQRKDNNLALGMDFKANLPYNLQLYGQLLFDQIDKPISVKGSGGWQIGAKALDIFNIPNLDIQAEINQVQPFTYATNDSVSQFTHFLQPLAHPLGANFREWIGLVRYQPFTKWQLSARLNYWKQGVDTTRASFGSNPNILTEAMAATSSFLGGQLQKTLNTSLLVSYEVRENLFLEGALWFRNLQTVEANTRNYMITAGVRWNMFRRDYDY